MLVLAPSIVVLLGAALFILLSILCGSWLGLLLLIVGIALLLII